LLQNLISKYEHERLHTENERLDMQAALRKHYNKVTFDHNANESAAKKKQKETDKSEDVYKEKQIIVHNLELLAEE